MAAKTKLYDKSNPTVFNGHDFAGLMPATKPGIVSLNNTLKMFGVSDADTRRKIIDACMASIVSDDSKGASFIDTALTGSKKAAQKAKAAVLVASNRAILDDYNTANADEIAGMSDALDVAMVALAQAKEDFASMQDAVSSALKVDWPLDVSIVKHSETGKPSIYVPSDSLGSAPAKKSKGGTRFDRVYDFSAGSWDKTVTSPDFGTLVWTVKGNETDGFSAKLSWTNGDKTRSKTGKDPVMSSAGKIAYYAMLQDLAPGNDKATENLGKHTAANKLPINLMSTLKLTFERVAKD